MNTSQLFMFSFITVFFTALGYASNSDVDEFPISDAINKWKSVQNNTVPIHCVFDREEKSTHFPQIQPLHVTLNIAGENFVYEIFAKGKKEVLYAVDGKNKKYSFKISSTNEPPAWVVNKVENSFSAQEIELFIRPLYTLWFVSTVPIWEIFSDSTFKIINAKKEGDLWRVDFSLSSQSNKRTLAAMRSGMVLLDSSHHWAIKEYKIISIFNGNSDNPVTTEVKSEYFTSSDFPFPVPVSFTRTSKSSIGEETESYLYNEYKKGHFKDGFSTLTAYGLPEPDFGEQRVFFLRYILIGIGFLLIAIGIWRVIQERLGKSS
ncbi:MAG: hypothetical protein LBT05_06015 [Planctomycetaceae bacterium]|jgi:hypothetical protein|nr:hypothetical protein [Planctomycetaceae bacterium]